MMTAVITAILIFSMYYFALYIFARGKIFAKAGQGDWKALIPVYREFTLFKITWGSGWKFLFLLIPVAQIVFYILTMVKLGKAFRKNAGFIIGLILLPLIFEMILALDKSQYTGILSEKQA